VKKEMEAVFTEYLSDIARIARKQKLRCVMVSCGFMNPEPLKEMCEVLDAIKIDLKGFSEKFYKEVCSASLKPVLDSLINVKKENVWLEIVNLVIPTLNDDLKMIDEMCRWIKENLGLDTPVHFTRFHPNYKLTHLSPTPVSALESAYEIAKEDGLRYVYIGNVPGHIRNSTFCPSCNKRIVYRTHFDVLEMNLTEGKCKFCGFPIPGKWA
jgi:pyruvate formate lyase activating enzyme